MISNQGLTSERIFIAGGRSNNSVILFEEKNNFYNNDTQYEIFELVEHVFLDCIKFYFSNED